MGTYFLQDSHPTQLEQLEQLVIACISKLVHPNNSILI